MIPRGNREPYGVSALSDAAVLRVLARLAVILAGVGVGLLFVLLAMAALAAVSTLVVAYAVP